VYRFRRFYARHWRLYGIRAVMGIIHKKQGQALRLVPVFLLFISVNDFIYRRLGHFVKPLGLHKRFYSNGQFETF
jgi:hypothetical protein